MASLLALFYAFLLLATMNAVAGDLTEFKVGDTGGWREPDANSTSMYSQWAAKNRFQVGDSLNFEYKEDSVLVVEKWGYHHCNTSNPISAFNNGKTVIKLDKPGPIYFISGAPDHCKNGQRLVVDVLTVHPTPPSIAVPPQSYNPTDSFAPSPLPSSGVSVAVAAIPFLMALTATLVTLVSGSP
ncbi:hypothetical protein HHK36_014177 [Tetracentron sinense]|uniref:Phytocyanin domain-containing protein n=1 Tax=Tetracentron sinense TaxID=13715 RepID=A0A834Z4M0_TETSI|nr:hypothetical protein HHK36_014177 [Tetracentron sinense]